MIDLYTFGALFCLSREYTMLFPWLPNPTPCTRVRARYIYPADGFILCFSNQKAHAPPVSQESPPAAMITLPQHTMKHLVVIGGPTAAGKTALAIEVAKQLDTEIISGDSRQFYREMAIGNARPDPGELAAVKHHFIADRSVHQPLSAGRFAAEALDRLETIFTTSDYAVLVGGSGLYLRALCTGLDEFPPVTARARARVEGIVAEQGLAGLQAALASADPDYFSTVDQQNARRLERALLVSYSAGKPYSSFLGNRPPRPFNSHYFRVTRPRPELYERINLRVDQMLSAGLQAEAKELYPHKEMPVLQTVGYQEWWPYFAGEYAHERAVELIKQHSRRYAKRQETWFRKGGIYQPVTTLAEVVASVGL